MDTAELEEFFGPVISSYSRAQALEDGVLVDCSALAREQGIRYPVALTAAAAALCTPPKRSNQDYTGRVWDVLTIYRFAARGAEGDRFFFKVRIGRSDVVLKAVCGPNDDLSPCITISLPEED